MAEAHPPIAVVRGIRRGRAGRDAHRRRDRHARRAARRRHRPAGGAISSLGSIVLDLSRMDRILEISDVDELAVVEAGVLNGDLDRAARERGLWFAPTPRAARSRRSAATSRPTPGACSARSTGSRANPCSAWPQCSPTARCCAPAAARSRASPGTTSRRCSPDRRARSRSSSRRPCASARSSVATRTRSPPRSPTSSRPARRSAATASAHPARPARAHRPRRARTRHRAPRCRGLAGTPLADFAPGETFLLAQCDAGDAADEAEAIARVFEAAGGRVTRSTDAATGERLLDIRRAMHPRSPRAATCSSRTSPCRAPACPRCSARSPRSARATASRSPRSRTRATATCTRTSSSRATRCPTAIWAAADELFRTGVGSAAR